MSEESSCVLCLEPIGASTGQVDIDSTEGQELNAQQILEKYFKTELDAAASLPIPRILCRQCWETVFGFHEFCLRVQRAHFAPVTFLDVKAEVLDGEVLAIDIATPSPKRRRGRPRRNIAAKASAQMPLLQECKVVMEKLDISSLQLKLQAENLHLSATELDNLRLDKIKYTALQENTIDMEYSADGNESEPGSVAFSPTDQLADSEPEAEPKKRKLYGQAKKKKNYSVQTMKMLNGDEYIAKHFKLTCCLCGISLVNFSALKGHFRREHQTRGYVRCCGKKLLKRGLLVDHLHVHQDPLYFQCPRCGRAMADRRCLELHLKNHDLNRDRIYKCDFCSKSFFRKIILMRHIMTHAPADQKTHACPRCDKTFPTNYTMTQHLKLVHLNMYAKICDVCGKLIRGREALRRHMDGHAGVEPAPIQCEICGASLTNKYGLARHMKTMHTAEYQTPQTCPVCAKVSPSIQAHQHHMKYMHSMKRTHPCPLCDKAFKRSTVLKEHMTTHTGEVLYTCTFCPRTFNSNANMYAHRKKKHPMEWAESQVRKQRALQNTSEGENSATSQLVAPKNRFLIYKCICISIHKLSTNHQNIRKYIVIFDIKKDISIPFLKL